MGGGGGRVVLLCPGEFGGEKDSGWFWGRKKKSVREGVNAANWG